MSAVVGSLGPDALEEKFFDLVVQPSVEPPSSSKPPAKTTKPEFKKIERRYRPGVHYDRQDRRRLIVGHKKPKEKEESKELPTVEFSSEQAPLQIALTPNPSPILLQCRIQQEVKDAEQNKLLMKKRLKDKKVKESASIDEKPSSDTTSATTIPQIIQLGLSGVFELIRETAAHHHVLCCKALQALLHMLQGQKLEGMRNEPTDVLEELFQTLLSLSRLSEETVPSATDDKDDFKTSLPGIGPANETNKSINNIPSLACSCLLSLAFAWGSTEKLLTVVASFVADCSSQKGPLFIKVPATFIELQRTVMASLLEKDHIPSPLQSGLGKKSLLQTWKVECSHVEPELLSLQCDGTYLYALFANSLLMKIGTGYNSTVQGHVYRERVVNDLGGSSHAEEETLNLLMWFDDSLYGLTNNGTLCLIHRSDFSVTCLLQVSLDNGAWFCGDVPWSINTSASEETFVLKSYTTDGKKLLPKKSLKVCPVKQLILKLGNGLHYHPVKESLKESESIDVVQILVGADFSICRTSHGHVYYSGKAESLGLKGKSKRVSPPELLPVPATSKICHLAVASDGGHALLIAETGEVYFVGSSHRGEDGETSKGKRQPARKPRLMKCMEGKKAVSGYCNSGTSALITDDGKLYLFGKDSTQADSKTGFVSSLSHVRVKQVALGKAHIVVMSEDGRVWTAGINNRGQCGRQEGAVSISQRIAEVEQEKDVSMPEDKSLEEVAVPAGVEKRDAPIAPVCSPDKHKWKMDVCMVCSVCCECTGYGSRCINSTNEGRYPGMVCGCGSGCSGCSECGCCKTCAGEADVNSAAKLKDVDALGFPPADLAMPDGSTLFFNKLSALLHHKNAKKGGGSSNEKKGLNKLELLNALLPLVEVHFPKKAAQIACGDHHTVVLSEDGQVYVFGKNHHGQLGLGDTVDRNTPTLLTAVEKITQISCGSHHTLLLSESRYVYGCGSNARGQLGSSNHDRNITSARIIDHKNRASWISATQSMSFIKYSQVLFNPDKFKKAKMFGNASFVGILYNPTAVQTPPESRKSRLLLVDLKNAQCQHFDDAIDVAENAQACVDGYHDVLWSLNASDWRVKSYFLCGYKDGLTEEALPFSPRLAIPLRHGSLTTRTQAGLNLLACLNTLVTLNLRGPLSAGKRTGESNSSEKAQEKTEHTIDEYNIVSRFKSHGGGWGYSVHSTEAIRFMADTDVLLGGVGVFGGRGEYTAEVAVYEELGDSEVVGGLLVETDPIPYECGFRDKFHVLFDEPVPIKAGAWYAIACKVSGPSSDCGSHGEQHVTGSDNVKFTFRRSKRSNNGTDVSAGQIPELLYSIPSLKPVNEVEVQMKPKNLLLVQNLSKDFYMSVKEGMFESLPFLLDWARTSLFMDISRKSSRYEDGSAILPVHEKIVTETMSNLAFVVIVCLRLLRVAIKQVLAREGTTLDYHSCISQCVGLVELTLTDGEIDAALNDALLLTNHDRELVVSSSIAMVTECHHLMIDCVDAFYPTPPQKWNYLHQALENYKTASAAKKSHVARLLVAVFDSLSQPSVDLVQCLPLFPRTLSNLASVASPCADSTSSVAGTSDSPLVGDATAVGFYEVSYFLVEIACSPAQAVLKYGDHVAANRASAFAKDSDGTFSTLLLFPEKSLVTSACKLLSTLTSSLAYRATDATKLLTIEKQESPLLSVTRFERVNNDRPWETGNGSVDGICFEVDAEGVLLCGVGVYGGGNREYKYDLTIFEKNMSEALFSGDSWEILDHVRGSYTLKDVNSERVCHVKLNRNLTLKKNTQYAIQLENYGERTYCGESGLAMVKRDGVTFQFFRFDQCNNGTGVNRGQIPTLFYIVSPPDDELLSSPDDKWLGTATTPTTAGLAYQRHALNVLAFVTESTVEILKSLLSRGDGEDDDSGSLPGESFFATKSDDIRSQMDVKEKVKSILSTQLVSSLLPELFSHIGVLIRQDPHCAVEVMEIIKTILLPLISVQQLACPSYKNGAKTHTVVVESSHPYKAATVEQYKAAFPDSIKWMLVEFSSKSQTGQPEDFLQLYLMQAGAQGQDGKGKANRLHPVLSKMSQDKNWPQEAILLPGHELTFVLESASDYTNNRDQKPQLFYGFACTVTGYESVGSDREQDGSSLVNELINTAGLASKMLMKAHEQLWIDDESPNASAASDNLQDKMEHLKAIERTASVTLERHAPLFLAGLHLDFFPTAPQALSGSLPICNESKEKLFLQDFISTADDTPGGRLARWLQPGPYVDPKQCVLRLNTRSLFHTLPTSVTILTRDQYGNPAYVPTLKVELTVRPHPSPHVDHQGNGVMDAPSTDPSSMFESAYEMTKVKDSFYHAITMMRAYKKYSFEELRIAYPLKRTLKTENILVAHANKEVYRATWIPSMATSYTLQVTFDLQLKGPSQVVNVSETPDGYTEDSAIVAEREYKLLKFATRNSRGLRIRSEPTLKSLQVGLLEYDDVIEYCEQLQNTDGSWVKLSKASAGKYCKETSSEAWCIKHHRDNGRTFLVPVHGNTDVGKETDNKSEPSAGTRSLASKKKLQKILSKRAVKQDFRSRAAANGFAEARRSKVFPDPFSASGPLPLGDWKESVPGEYKVASCGKAGHNIRYNPSLKAAPIGKLILGNVFVALSVKRNKSGIWLLLHKASVSQFCEDPPDQRHAWTLAVSRDGTQYLRLKEIVEQEEKTPVAASQPTVLGESPFQAIPAEATESSVSGPAANHNHNVSNGSRDSDAASPLASSPASMWSLFGSKPLESKKGDDQAPSESSRERLLWKSVVVRKHQRSPSESDALKQITDSDISPGRRRRSSASCRESSRSHSTPGARPNTTSRSKGKLSNRKTLVEQQSLRARSASEQNPHKATPKSIRGGRKSVPVEAPTGNAKLNDIPFIDEVVDSEGNILSPEKNEVKFLQDSPAEGFIDDFEPIGTVQTAFEKIDLTSATTIVPQRKEVSRKDSERSSAAAATKDSKAVSPLVAECARTVFAAFMWHEGIIHDAMACASFLKFNDIERSQILKPVGSKEASSKRRSSESNTDEQSKTTTSHPPATLVYLAMFWDRMSETVIKIAIKNQNLPPPAPVNQNLNSNPKKSAPIKIGKRSDAAANAATEAEQNIPKVPPLKRKALAKNDQNLPGMIPRRILQHNIPPYLHPLQVLHANNKERKDRFREMPCDLCDQICPYPVTYHMKRSHPGCGKFAGGLGYNSSGHYCGGWAGDCGDGGIGGSTWYLLCVRCREKYLAEKNPSSQPKAAAQKTSSNWASKLHHVFTQPANAHQVMKGNALFLLNLVSASSNTTPLYEQQPDAASKLDPLPDVGEMDSEKIWEQTDLLPHSTFCFCPFPSIPCAYLTMHGKENGINNNIGPSQKTSRSPKEYRNRSLSNQATPSSGHMKHLFNQTHAMTPVSTTQTESNVLQRSSKLMRSVSTGSQPQRIRTSSGGDVSPNGGPTGSFLLHHPSASMKRLMRGKSGNSNNIARDAVHGSPVLSFVTQRHDLKSLDSTLQITLRRAALRVYVLQALTWLLRTVVSETSIHDILWYFVSGLAGSSSNTNRNNDSAGDVTDDEIEETRSIYEHPVKEIWNAGMHSRSPVVEAFHAFLQTVSDIMMDLPPNSPVQLMAIRCWSLRVLPSDHQFLHKSKVFSHISQILSKVDGKQPKATPSRLVKVKLNQKNQQYVPIADLVADSGSVSRLVDFSAEAQIKPSSHPAMANSLTDNSTETFWESGDEDKNKLKQIVVAFQDLPGNAEKLCVHIDNTRDVQKKVTSVSLFFDNDDDWVKSTVKELTNQFAGWITFQINPPVAKLKIELRGPDNGLRVRQIKVLGRPKEGSKYVEQLPGQVLRSQMCEAEVLKVFKLLTAEVFGQLLSEQPSPKDPFFSKSSAMQKSSGEGLEEEKGTKITSGSLPVSPSDVDPNLREHMVGILFSRSKLTSLQKKVFEHTVLAVHTETTHIRKVWCSSLEPVSPSNQPKAESSDSYCFELLSMILALSGSDVGCHFVAQQSVLIEDFVSLLHIGTPRIQRQITLLLRRILPKVTPDELATILSANIPSHDKLIDASTPEVLQEQSSSSPTIPSTSGISVLDLFFACIAKSLQVQVKGIPDLLRMSDVDGQSLSKRSRSLSMQVFFTGKPDADCPTWWLHGSAPDQSTVEEVIKLLLDMSADKISPVWGKVTKCSISESILALTQLSVEEREPPSCMRTPVLWRALASLCVLDREHVEKLSSARSNSNKNKVR